MSARGHDDPNKFFASLEECGEADVRNRLALKVWSDPRTVALAEEWLRSKDADRASSSAERKEAREVETLSIARKALRNSRLASSIAIMAMILSTIMAIQKLIEWNSR